MSLPWPEMHHKLRSTGQIEENTVRQSVPEIDATAISTLF
jgi:hypothetical protein